MAKLLLRRRPLFTNPLPPAAAAAAAKTLTLTHSPRRPFCSDIPPSLRDRIHLLTEKPSAAITASGDLEDLSTEFSSLAAALLSSTDPPAPLLSSLSAAALLRRSPTASLDLLSHLCSRPILALEVFDWRRTHAAAISPVLPEEYVKAITLASRAKNPDLAADLFSDARGAGLDDPRLYNALMSGYMYNGLTKKSISVFEDFKRDALCTPTIVTYNILLSVFGRSMLVDHMEGVLSLLERSKIAPNLSTYNTVIAAYVTAWMWDRMENTFQLLKASSIQPDVHTHLLMLRGHAHAGNLEKMEEFYELVKDRVNDNLPQLIRIMICAYCKSSSSERVQRVEALSKFIPEDDYRPWLNVLLIRLYAQEGLMDPMERFITEAIERNTEIFTVRVMRSIVTSYFNCNAADRLALFVKQAEDAGWMLCRSLYHSRMVLYGKQNRIEEMHGVLDEMEANKFCRTKKTFLILHKAYSKLGRRYEVETIVGLMWKYGFFGVPGEASPFLDMS